MGPRGSVICLEKALPAVECCLGSEIVCLIRNPREVGCSLLARPGAVDARLSGLARLAIDSAPFTCDVSCGTVHLHCIAIEKGGAWCPAWAFASVVAFRDSFLTAGVSFGVTGPFLELEGQADSEAATYTSAMVCVSMALAYACSLPSECAVAVRMPSAIASQVVNGDISPRHDVNRVGVCRALWLLASLRHDMVLAHPARKGAHPWRQLAQGCAESAAMLGASANRCVPSGVRVLLRDQAWRWVRPLVEMTMGNPEFPTVGSHGFWASPPSLCLSDEQAWVPLSVQGGQAQEGGPGRRSSPSTLPPWEALRAVVSKVRACARSAKLRSWRGPFRRKAWSSLVPRKRGPKGLPFWSRVVSGESARERAAPTAVASCGLPSSCIVMALRTLAPSPLIDSICSFCGLLPACCSSRSRIRSVLCPSWSCTVRTRSRAARVRRSVPCAGGVRPRWSPSAVLTLSVCSSVRMPMPRSSPTPRAYWIEFMALLRHVAPATFPGVHCSGGSDTWAVDSERARRIDFVTVEASLLGAVRGSGVWHGAEFMACDRDHLPVCVSVLVPLGAKGDSARPVRVPYDARKLRVPACMMEFERCLESIPPSRGGLIRTVTRSCLVTVCARPSCTRVVRARLLLREPPGCPMARGFWSKFARSSAVAFGRCDGLLDRPCSPGCLGRGARTCGRSQRGGSGAGGLLWSGADLAIADCRRRIWAVASKARAAVRADKRMFVWRQIEEAVGHAESNRSREFFRSLAAIAPPRKEAAPCLNDKGVKVTSSLEAGLMWANFFAEKVHGGRVEPADLVHRHRQLALSQCAVAPSAVMHADLPFLDEIEAGMRARNPHKSCGIELISSAVFKEAAGPLSMRFYPLILKYAVWCWEPIAWKGGRMAPVWKHKGSASDMATYRGVQVADISGKLLHSAYRRRLISLAGELMGKFQFGAMSGRGTDLASWCVRGYQRLMSFRQRSHAFVFIDVVAAFDSVIKELVTGSFLDRSVPEGRLERVCGGDRGRVQAVLALVYSEPVLCDANISAHLRRAVMDAHAANWFTVAQCDGLFEAHTGTRPGDPFGDVVYCLFAGKEMQEIHERLLDGGLCDSIPFGCFVSMLGEPRVRDRVAVVREISYIDDAVLPVSASVPGLLLHKVASTCSVVASTFRKFGLSLSFEPNKSAVLIRLFGGGAKAVRLELHESGGVRFQSDGAHLLIRCVKSTGTLGA